MTGWKTRSEFRALTSSVWNDDIARAWRRRAGVKTLLQPISAMRTTRQRRATRIAPPTKCPITSRVFAANFTLRMRLSFHDVINQVRRVFVGRLRKVHTTYVYTQFSTFFLDVLHEYTYSFYVQKKRRKLEELLTRRHAHVFECEGRPGHHVILTWPKIREPQRHKDEILSNTRKPCAY